jgi:hypothetical protein
VDQLLPPRSWRPTAEQTAAVHQLFFSFTFAFEMLQQSSLEFGGKVILSQVKTEAVVVLGKGR